MWGHGPWSLIAFDLLALSNPMLTHSFCNVHETVYVLVPEHLRWDSTLIWPPVASPAVQIAPSPTGRSRHWSSHQWQSFSGHAAAPSLRRSSMSVAVISASKVNNQARHTVENLEMKTCWSKLTSCAMQSSTLTYTSGGPSTVPNVCCAWMPHTMPCAPQRIQSYT